MPSLNLLARPCTSGPTDYADEELQRAPTDVVVRSHAFHDPASRQRVASAHLRPGESGANRDRRRVTKSFRFRDEEHSQVNWPPFRESSTMVKPQHGQWVVPNPQICRTFGLLNIIFGGLM